MFQTGHECASEGCVAEQRIMCVHVFNYRTGTRRGTCAYNVGLTCCVGEPVRIPLSYKHERRGGADISH
jgi:hypothetical protein